MKLLHHYVRELGGVEREVPFILFKLFETMVLLLKLYYNCFTV